ncbi:hypothetical protein [Nocardioides yefusunii]|uniref:DUF5753 domain-containing protein n=1 Tax=Nocardioides yefusunii TaxID=2500546 RepID=A0ABW1QZK5_9ACTN|nr:hypothetical protein [Nocardioides yefusunii]
MRTFTVGRAGQFRGDDGTGGRLAPALHYASRMAAQLDRVLGTGPLQRVVVDGPRAITAAVEWSASHELLLHASLSAGTTTPFLLPRDDEGPRARHASEAIWVRARHGAESMARIDEVLRAVHAHAGADWTVLLDENLTALRLFGTPSASTLAIVASRCHGVLRGLGLPEVHSLTLTYASGSLVLLPSDDVMTLLSSPHTDPGALVDVVARAHAALADPAAATAAALDATLGPAVREPVYTPRPRPAEAAAAEPVVDQTDASMPETRKTRWRWGRRA